MRRVLTDLFDSAAFVADLFRTALVEAVRATGPGQVGAARPLLPVPLRFPADRGSK